MVQIQPKHIHLSTIITTDMLQFRAAYCKSGLRASILFNPERTLAQRRLKGEGLGLRLRSNLWQRTQTSKDKQNKAVTTDRAWSQTAAGKNNSCSVFLSLHAGFREKSGLNPWLQVHVLLRQMYFSSIHFVFALQECSSFMSRRKGMPVSAIVNLNATTRLQIRCLCCTQFSVVWIIWILLCSNECTPNFSLKVGEGCYSTVYNWLYPVLYGGRIFSVLRCHLHII